MAERPQRRGTAPREPIRILRVIARMNVGGPAYHVSVVGGRMDTRRYASLLVYGSVGRGEASFAWLAEREGCRAEPIEQLSPEIHPLADLAALARLVRVIRRYRPHVVETHTAKAGLLGRLAAVLGARPRPAIVHTYHGHVLEGYFGPLRNLVYRTTERWLARISDRLVAVSEGNADDLVRLGVAPPDRFRVIPVALELERFVQDHDPAAATFRDRIRVRDGETLLAYVGRLVPIKRVDVVLNAVARLRAAGLPVRLVLVGDGGCRRALEELAAELGLTGAATFLGYMQDVTAVTAAADVAVLGSDNEGSPVSLIEAAAAARPAVATAVGGVPDVVVHGETGLLVEPGDDAALADAIRRLVEDPALRTRMGARAREHVLRRFSSGDVIHELETLYDELVAGTPPRPLAAREALLDDGPPAVSGEP